jgi:hypothetical protein
MSYVSRIEIVALILVSALVLALPTSARADDAMVKSFANGNGQATVGIGTAEGTDDNEEEGPQAIASDASGKLLLLDQVNGRILSFDPSNPIATPQTLELPKNVQATDLVVSGSSVYIWDGKIHEMQALGPEDAAARSLTETRSADPPDESTITAFAQMGSQTDRSGLGLGAAPTRGVGTEVKASILEHQAVNTKGRGLVMANVTITDRGAGTLISVRGKRQERPTELRLRVRGKIGMVALLEIDKLGRMFVLVENIPINIGEAAGAFVVRYSTTGSLEGVYELPLAETSIVSRRVITVSPNGEVYFLKSRKNVVEVLGLGFRATPNAGWVDSLRNKPNYAALAWNNGKGVSMAVGPLTRQRVIQTALEFEAATWMVTTPNYGNDDTAYCSGFNGRIRRPPYLLGKQGQQVRSVPYCWGCQGTLNQFMAKVQRGALAGNVCTRNNPRTDVVGVDCSSFVSAAWGLSTHFTTSTIPSISRQLANPWDLLPGDALDKPGSHVMLFLGFTPDRQVDVVEATPGSCAGRVCRNVYSLTSLLARGYFPVRYRALAERGN